MEAEAAAAALNLECCLPVPSVQELAIQQPEAAPPRYIRDDVVGDHFIAVDRVPLIDMNKLVNPDSQDAELQRLHSACKHWGLFQVVNIYHHRSSDSVTIYICFLHSSIIQFNITFFNLMQYQLYHHHLISFEFRFLVLVTIT